MTQHEADDILVHLLPSFDSDDDLIANNNKDKNNVNNNANYHNYKLDDAIPAQPFSLDESSIQFTGPAVTDGAIGGPQRGGALGTAVLRDVTRVHLNSANKMASACTISHSSPKSKHHFIDPPHPRSSSPTRSTSTNSTTTNTVTQSVENVRRQNLDAAVPPLIYEPPTQSGLDMRVASCSSRATSSACTPSSGLSMSAKNQLNCLTQPQHQQQQKQQNQMITQQTWWGEEERDLCDITLFNDLFRNLEVPPIKCVQNPEQQKHKKQQQHQPITEGQKQPQQEQPITTTAARQFFDAHTQTEQQQQQNEDDNTKNADDDAIGRQLHAVLRANQATIAQYEAAIGWLVRDRDWLARSYEVDLTRLANENAALRTELRVCAGQRDAAQHRTQAIAQHVERELNAAQQRVDEVGQRATRINTEIAQLSEQYGEMSAELEQQCGLLEMELEREGRYEKQKENEKDGEESGLESMLERTHLVLSSEVAQLNDGESKTTFDDHNHAADNSEENGRIMMTMTTKQVRSKTECRVGRQLDRLARVQLEFASLSANAVRGAFCNKLLTLLMLGVNSLLIGRCQHHHHQYNHPSNNHKHHHRSHHQ